MKKFKYTWCIILLAACSINCTAQKIAKNKAFQYYIYTLPFSYWNPDKSCALVLERKNLKTNNSIAIKPSAFFTWGELGQREIDNEKYNHKTFGYGLEVEYKKYNNKDFFYGGQIGYKNLKFRYDAFEEMNENFTKMQSNLYAKNKFMVHGLIGTNVNLDDIFCGSVVFGFGALYKNLSINDKKIVNTNQSDIFEITENKSGLSPSVIISWRLGFKFKNKAAKLISN